MAAPGMLFGETREDYGCWEWKGPVIQELTTAYGKFFNRKAGFVALDLWPDFINYRRDAYPIEKGSTEQMIHEIIRTNEGLSSTELRRIVFGTHNTRKKPKNMTDTLDAPKPKRHSLEGPLQRLQMGTWLLIADFEYKYTTRGDRYGWGVAVYSTPEIWFERNFKCCGRTPKESFDFLVNSLSAKLPGINRDLIAALIK